MDIERTLETQRHRLLRIVAGLVIVVGVLAIGPVSRRFSDWTLGFVGPLLSRIDAAVRYLIITQACLMVDRSGLDIDRKQITIPCVPNRMIDETNVSLVECRQKLNALRAMLMNLPRHALRLLRRIAKEMQCINDQCPADIDQCPSTALSKWRHAVFRIERPPDNIAALSLFILTPPGYRGGRRWRLNRDL